MEHSNAIEKIGIGLVYSLETFKGAKIELVKRLSGFNGLSVYKYSQVRKIEVKTFQKGDKWIAINDMKVIDKLFFEQDYWISFVLIPENIVICTKDLAFIQQQLKLSENLEYLADMEKWMVSTKNLAKSTGLQLTLKINVPFSFPLQELLQNILVDKSKEWEKSVVEIWENKANWQKISFRKLYRNLIIGVLSQKLINLSIEKL
ncbi:MAG: hypothetical protein OHK0057_06840 [Thermoflexibacter sp.]